MGIRVYTDFKVLDGVIPVKDARTSHIFELVRLERDIIRAGAQAVSFEHERVRDMTRILIADHWRKFSSAGQRQMRGDRGGFYGHFEQDMEGIVRQVMKPLDACYQNLANAQYNLTRYPIVFAQWMEPLKRPGAGSGGVTVDGGW
jgi:hypothetical protein